MNIFNSFIEQNNVVWQEGLTEIDRSLDAISKEEKKVFQDLNELFCLTLSTQNPIQSIEGPFDKKLLLYKLSETFLNPPSHNAVALNILNLITTSKPREYRLVLNVWLGPYFDFKGTLLANRIVKLHLRSLHANEIFTLFSKNSSAFPNLHSLTLENSDLTFSEEQLKSLGKLKHLSKDYPHLKKITLIGPKITNEIVNQWIKAFKNNLTTLKLKNCAHKDLNDVLRFNLAEIPELGSVHFNECKNITHKMIRLIGKNCKKLTSLNLDNSPNISQKLISKIIQHTPSLHKLCLSNHQYITDDLLEGILKQSGKTLQALDISGCTQITDEAILKILNYCPNLTDLNLERCFKLTQKSIEALVKAPIKLTAIHFEELQDLTDEHVGIIGKRFGKELHTISIKYCYKITDKSANLLVDTCSNLKVICLFGSPLLTSKILHTLYSKFPDCISHFQKEAFKGNAVFECLLGSCYASGVGLTKDEKQAFHYVQKAANQNLGHAQRLLSIWYTTGTYVIKDEKEGLKWLEKAAKLGYAPAQTILGFHCLKEHKHVEAIEWFEMAAYQKIPDAQCALGTFYLKGMGMSLGKNEERGLALLKSAAPYSLLAQATLGVYFLSKNKEREGFEYLQKAIDQNFPPALLQLGLYYLDRKKEKEGLELLQKAADQDSPDALLILAEFYQKGILVIKEEKRALALLQRAADLGMAQAQFILGTSYDEGTWLKQDYQMAFYWVKKAADQNHPEALYFLSCYYNKGIGVKKNETEAQKFLQKAAEAGHPQAALVWMNLPDENGRSKMMNMHFGQ